MSTETDKKHTPIKLPVALIGNGQSACYMKGANGEVVCTGLTWKEGEQIKAALNSHASLLAALEYAEKRLREEGHTMDADGLVAILSQVRKGEGL